MCPVCLDKDASGAEVIADAVKEGQSSNSMTTEFTCLQHRNEFWQTKSKPSLRTSPPQEVVNVAKNMETKIIRKTTYASKGPKATLRNT